jgi:hypothetical protein
MVYIFLIPQFLRHQTMDKVQKYNSFSLAALPPGKEPLVPVGEKAGWPRAILDVVVKRKIPSPCQELNPRSPIIQPIAQRYTN